MFATFKKEVGRDRTTFRSGEQISLFGRNKGWIPWLLQQMMPNGQGEPYRWHIHIHDGLALPAVRKEYPNVDAIIVDIKPTAKDQFLVCELEDVYGYSADGWTPLLWHMQVLSNGEPKANHLEDFDARSDGKTIYEFLYATGGVDNGEIIGTWNAPRPSSTNGVLLWPEALKYFMECIRAGRPPDTK